ncbi:MAG TPA: amidohydrolase family protein [Reyranella sp.]|nr:amidohydrolase family protein [Reyranella sp.]
MTNLTRRNALVALGGALLMPAHSAFGQPVQSVPNDPLTIDIHTHVFNASDLQVGKFLEQVYFLDKPILKLLGPVMQAVGHLAPKGDQELAFLGHVTVQFDRGGNTVAEALVSRESDAQFQRARTGLLDEYLRLRRTDVRVQNEEGAELERQIRQLQLDNTYDAYKARLRNLRPTRDLFSSVAAGLDFIMRNLQYRYVNATDYLKEYGNGPRKVDLMVCHLVDYDVPLGETSTRTPLAEQIAVMERISHLTNGRVHAFAPYCPFKRIAFTLGLPVTDPLQLVHTAIESQGHLGVKLYPPMGFRPYGNCELQTEFWRDSMLPSRLLAQSNLGELVDKALADLYSWCASRGVPIMAHTSPSNYPVKKYQTFIMNPLYWQAVLEEPRFKGLRVNFGHFGDTDIVKDGNQNAKILVDFMAVAGGENYYADSAYFEEILTDKLNVERRIRDLLQYSGGRSDAALSRRLMYGTDWEMVIVEGGTTDYLADFEQVIADLDPSGHLANRFFGVNAASYLGLAPGGGARMRLERFYAQRGTLPSWMSKANTLPI